MTVSTCNMQYPFTISEQINVDTDPITQYSIDLLTGE